MTSGRGASTPLLSLNPAPRKSGITGSALVSAQCFVGVGVHDGAASTQKVNGHHVAGGQVEPETLASSPHCLDDGHGLQNEEEAGHGQHAAVEREQAKA